MSRLVLVGDSGLAREVLATERLLGRYTTVAMLDDDPKRWGRTVDGAEVIGPVELAAEPSVGDVLICIGAGASRRVVVERLSAMCVTGDRYATVVHPSVVLPPTCEVGYGSVLLAGVVLTADVRVENHVVVMPNVTLTHDNVLRDYATVCAGVALGGNVTIGEAAYVGMKASVRQGAHVGADSTLGMGGVLLEDLPAGQTWVGVPARSIAIREQLVS
jgi:sugar O-acyltransferase (sialic acid O-acetyltransferase NeuD family)